MKPIKLNNSELKVMDILWDKGPITAKAAAEEAAQLYQWNKNTTYTVLKGLVQKEAVSREEPNFICTPLLTRQQVQKQETRSLINKLYKGSAKLFFSSFLEEEYLTENQLEEIKKIIDREK